MVTAPATAPAFLPMFDNQRQPNVFIDKSTQSNCGRLFMLKKTQHRLTVYPICASKSHQSLVLDEKNAAKFLSGCKENSGFLYYLLLGVATKITRT